MATVGALLAEAKERLRAAPFAPPPREAHLLLGHVLGLGEARLLARTDDEVPAARAAAFRALLARRLTGEPVAYLTGEREFYGRSFLVDRRVLVPRPETEHLVEAVLADPSLPEDARILDVGAGSGAIAVTLALERPGWRVVATDLSPAALAVTRENARRLGVPIGGRLRLVACDLASALRLGTFDLLVSNPPYVPAEDRDTLSPEVRDFEPHAALFSPADEPDEAGEGGKTAPGMGIASRLLGQAAGLRPGGEAVLEIGHGHRDGVRAAGRRHGGRLLRAIPAYAGNPRVVRLAPSDTEPR
jgi:release factor glutamine methyltransferase